MASTRWWCTRGGTAKARLGVFVKTPVDPQRRTLDGFRINRYEPQPQAGRPTPPPAELVLTPANRDTRLSPHFRLDQFLCHQQPEHWPKYVLVQPRLLDKLERLHGALAEAGFPLDTITVMSGYRTPWYNADIGNTTRYSRHLFGGAADIYVDADGDDRMDDLNGDGTVDTRDAAWLADLVETGRPSRSGRPTGQYPLRAVRAHRRPRLPRAGEPSDHSAAHGIRTEAFNTPANAALETAPVFHSASAITACRTRATLPGTHGYQPAQPVHAGLMKAR